MVGKTGRLHLAQLVSALTVACWSVVKLTDWFRCAQQMFKTLMQTGGNLSITAIGLFGQAFLIEYLDILMCWCAAYDRELFTRQYTNGR
jgi:hypothetical protein